jgi:predicted metal-dependent enzyme (double-stranded beta helix superfamily)
MTNLQNLTAPTTGNALKVDLGNNTTATVTRVKAAYGNKREAMYSIYIEKDGERLFQTNRRGAGAWKSIKDDLQVYSQ